MMLEGTSDTMGTFSASLSLALLGVAPLLLVVTTSMAKFLMVLGLLRHALGTPSIPPTPVIVVLAALLSWLVMEPVAAPAFALVLESVVTPNLAPSELLMSLAGQGQPWLEFLSANTGDTEREALQSLLASHQAVSAAEATGATDIEALSSAQGFVITLLGFALTEVNEGLFLGAILFVPFVLIDLCVGSILMSLGMHMLSPTQVSLPAKLLLFSSVHGFLLLSESLVLGYVYSGG